MKTRAEHSRRLLVAALTLILAVMIGGGPALAEPSAEDEEAARAAGNTAAAEFACDLLPIGDGDLREKCVGLAEGAIAQAPSFEEIQPQIMCGALLPLGPVPTAGCVALVTANVGGLRDAAQTAYDATIGQAEEVIDTAKKAKAFIDDPQSAFEDIVNMLKEGAVDFLNKVMGELVNVGNADFSAEWWRNAYAAAGGIGLFVAAVMMIMVLKDAARDRISAHQLGESFQYLMGGIISMVWAPVLAYVVQNMIAAFNRGIISWGGEDIYETVLEGAIFSITANLMPGGVLMGLVFWFILFIGAVLVFVMFIAQGMAVYMTSVGMAIAFGMLAHPRWRSKALRVPMLVLGIMLAKPTLLFVITVLFMMIQSFKPLNLLGQDALQTLGEGCMIILALLAVGLAPWVAFKFIPLLPDGSEVDGGGFNPASAAAGAAGGMMMTVGMRRMQTAGAGASGDGGSPPSGKSSSTMKSAPNAPVSGTPGGKNPASATVGSAGGGVGKAGAAGASGASKAGAAGAAGKAGVAAGGAATGGALILAAMAARGTQTAAATAKTAAESAAPPSQGPSQEEQQSSLHDRRKWSE
ncbi:hypothetical protein [Brachybacterium paraconglomeratum]|uniref:hypothetical protein n=1 Tax=Brachybacterium paraconglomeratum TaxID=173362 RepID=UPI0022E33404|nr:hypothetical protein [Brachybacterium paraconglomeratum]